MEFRSLMIPSRVTAGQADSVEVGCWVGPNGCWRLESLEAHERYGIVDVVGTAFDPGDPDEACPLVISYAFRFVPLPPLAPGIALVRAGDLVDTLRVEADSTASERRLTFRADVYRAGANCGLAFLANEAAILNGVPAPIPPGRTRCLVRGTLSGEDACGLQNRFFRAYYLVDVHEAVRD